MERNFIEIFVKGDIIRKKAAFWGNLAVGKEIKKNEEKGFYEVRQRRAGNEYGVHAGSGGGICGIAGRTGICNAE